MKIYPLFRLQVLLHGVLDCYVCYVSVAVTVLSFILLVSATDMDNRLTLKEMKRMQEEICQLCSMFAQQKELEEKKAIILGEDWEMEGDHQPALRQPLPTPREVQI